MNNQPLSTATLSKAVFYGRSNIGNADFKSVGPWTSDCWKCDTLSSKGLCEGL